MRAQISQLLDPQMNKCMNEEKRDLFLCFISNIGSLTTGGVGETQLRELDSGKVGTPLLLRPLMVQQTCGAQILTYQQKDRIEHFTLWSDYDTHEPLLQRGVLLRPATLIQYMNSQLAYFPNISFVSYHLGKKTCLSVYRYKCHFFLSFADNQNMNYVI